MIHPRGWNSDSAHAHVEPVVGAHRPVGNQTLAVRPAQVAAGLGARPDDVLAAMPPVTPADSMSADAVSEAAGSTAASMGTVLHRRRKSRRGRYHPAALADAVSTSMPTSTRRLPRDRAGLRTVCRADELRYWHVATAWSGCLTAAADRRPATAKDPPAMLGTAVVSRYLRPLGPATTRPRAPASIHPDPT